MEAVILTLACWGIFGICVWSLRHELKVQRDARARDINPFTGRPLPGQGKPRS